MKHKIRRRNLNLISVSLAASIFLICQTGFAQPTSQSKTLLFAQVLELAKKNSVEKKRAEFALKIVDIDRKMLDTQEDPTIQYLSQAGVHVGNLPASLGGKPKKEGIDQTHSLILSFPLYDFGRLKAQRDRAGLQRKVVEQQVQEVEESVIFRVARAYLKVLTTQKIQKVTKQQLENVLKKLEEVTRSYKHGEKSQADFVKSKSDASRTKLALARASDDMQLAKYQLSFLYENGENSTQSGRSSESNLEFPDLELKSAADWVKVIKSWGLQVGKNATDNRREAERSAIEAQLQVIDTTSKPLLSSQIVPQISGSLFPLQPSVSAQIQFTYNIPWNGMVADQKEKVVLQKQDSDLQEMVDRKGRADRSKLANQQIFVSLGQMSDIENQVKLLTEYQGLVRTRYNAGKASALELSSTEDDVINAYLDLARTQFNIASAGLDIAEALGIKSLDNLF